LLLAGATLAVLMGLTVGTAAIAADLDCQTAYALIILLARNMNIGYYDDVTAGASVLDDRIVDWSRDGG